MRRPINTVNGTYKDPNLAFSAQDALNVIPMMTEKSGTRTVSQYRQAPGLKPFCRIGTNDGEEFTAAGAGRGLRVVDGKLYAVAGRNLWQITSAGVSVNYGTIPGVGRVSMAHNQRGLGNELAIDNGQSRYVFNTQTQLLQKVTDESFPGSIKAVFIDGYIVFVEPQGRYWGHSDLSNALSYNIFDQYEAEGQPDRIVSAHESNRELLIFGQDTTEAYVNNPSGSGEAPFVRATNTVIKSGCAARDSVCDVGPYTVYLDQNRTVQVLNGYTPVPISTSVIDSALQACTKQQIANAYAFSVESEGFQIYYLTVPGKFTFGYDFKNREWHRRSSTGLDWWAVTDVVQWNGSWYALDSRRGDILELRWYDYPFDVQEELVREWVTGTISADQNPIFVNELEVLFGCGGQAYTTVDFAEQPEAPTIAGTLPDGTMGQTWAGGTFTATGGTPPYRFVSRPGTVHVGNLGPMSSGGVVPAEIPDSIGSGLQVARVIDANGLWSETSAPYTIAPAMLAIRTRNESSVNYGDYLQGGAGTSWGGSWVQYSDPLPADPEYIRGVGSRFVAWAYGGHPRYTDDVGNTWNDCLGDEISTSGGVREACVYGDTVIIAGGIGLMARSVDGGRSFSNIPDSPAASCVSGIESNLIAIYPPTNSASKSTDGGGTWTTSTYPTGLFAGSSWLCSVYAAGSHYVFGAKQVESDQVAAAWRSENGSAWEELTLPFESAQFGTAITKIVIGGEESVLFAADSGEIAYLDPADDTVKLAEDSLGVRARGACYNGVVASIIGSSGGTGYIKHSTDFINWTTGKTESTLGGEWFGVAAQEASNE